MNFLKYSRDLYCRERTHQFDIEHLEKQSFDEDFVLEIPDQKFTEKINKYYDEIKTELPCTINLLFEENQGDKQ